MPLASLMVKIISRQMVSFPMLWFIIGLVYTQVLSRTDPARFEKLGHIVRGEDQEIPVSSVETSAS